MPGLGIHRGYTYFGVLFAVLLVSLALTGAAAVSEVRQQRLKEQQLLYVGQQYMAAIGSYYNAAPGGAKQYPQKLADLLRDPRYPTVKRHLRKPWPDPMTASGKWGLVRTREGLIAGVYSRAQGVPLKRSGFGSPELERDFADRKSYAQWKFIYRGGLTAAELPADGKKEAGTAARNRPAEE